MKIMHIITDLDTGGAEIMLYKLLASLRNEEINSSVISLMVEGKLLSRLRHWVLRWRR